ncbi:MAG: beta-lactamase family protein [Treponema sp.]|nr:beta-lactamase family protein [Treponema sp.]
MKKYVSKWDYKPALEVSVYGKEGTLSYHYRGGYFSITDDLSVSENSLFILYSITKSITATAVIDLINMGKLSLNDKVEDFFQDLNPLYINNDATIEELLTHRSGIQDYTENPALIYKNPFSYENSWDPLVILDYITIPADKRGTFIYSSTNYLLLGIIVEKVSGVSLCDYFQDKIFQPCNITMQLYPQDGIQICDIVHPHVYPNTFMGLYGDGKTPIDISTQVLNINELSIKCSWAAGGVVSNANNTAIWGYELLSENGKINIQIREKILESISKFSSNTSFYNAYGFGIRKLYYSGYELVGSYGRSLGCENLMFYNKDKDICIVILSGSNTKADGNPNIDELMFSIFDLL